MSKKWSSQVTKHSNALNLEKGIFTWKDPHKIALSLKQSAEQSKRRKASPYKSATDMLSFYINRAGKNLREDQKQILEDAKSELKKVFNR